MRILDDKFYKLIDSLNSLFLNIKIVINCIANIDDFVDIWYNLTS